MATENNTIKTTVELDTTQAQQKIIKLNATASDSTKTLDERVKAKNESVKLSNQLAAQNVKKLEEEKKALQKVNASEKDLNKVQTKLNKARINATKVSENGTKAQNRLNKSLNDSTNATSLFDKATGGLISKFGSFKSGLNAVGLGFKGIGGAIFASGLGLLVVTITAIVKAFKSSEEGQNKFAKIMGVIGSVTGNFVDLLADLGEKIISVFEDPGKALSAFGDMLKQNIINRFNGMLELIPALGKSISLLFKGEFKEAGKTAADAMGKVVLGVEDVTGKVSDAATALKDFTKEVVKDGGEAQKVADKRAEADKLERELLVSRAKAQIKINDLKLKSREEDKYSAAERVKFLKESSDLENAQFDKQQEIAKLRADAITLENTLSKSTKENLLAEAQAQAAVFDAESAKIAAQKKAQTQLNTLSDEAAADEKAKAAAAKAIKDKAEAENIERNAREFQAQLDMDEMDLARRQTLGEDTTALELAILEKKKAQELSNTELLESEKAVIEAKYANASEKITKISEGSKTDSKKDATDAAINMAGEEFGATQEVAVANMVMAAPKAVGNSFAKAAEAYPFPLSIAMGAAGAASSIIPIIKGLADIKKARFPGKKSGSSSSASSASISSTTSASTAATTTAVSDVSANNAANLGEDTSLSSAASTTAAANVSGSSGSNVVFSESAYSDFQDQVSFKEEKTSI